MTRPVNPTFRDLTGTEGLALLARNHVARIAYSFHDHVDIEPISYVFADAAIYMRTAPGSKLGTLTRAPWVALEVDEIQGPFDWQSVVAHGTVYLLRESGSPTDRATYRTAVDHLRRLMPEVLTEEDPVPARRILLRLVPNELTGRAASTKDSKSSGPDGGG